MSQLSAFKRLGEPEEIADLVVCLAPLDQARWITGASPDVAGGSLRGATLSPN